jgi:hypothetical protein
MYRGAYCPPFFVSSIGTKTSDTELTQWRVSFEVYFSPLKTWPKCPSQLVHVISVRLPSASVVFFTAPLISSSKLGHPQLDSNLSEELYKGALHCLQT